METTEIPTWLVPVIVVAILALITYLAYKTGTVLSQIRCPRCKLHISSVKVAAITYSTITVIEQTREEQTHRGRRVCSTCWNKLAELGFDTDGNWPPGVITEYLKNTPNFVTVFISIGALIVSIFALLS